MDFGMDSVTGRSLDEKARRKEAIIRGNTGTI
jgi:hypothetical protein